MPVFLSLKQVQSLRGKLSNECITLKIEGGGDRKVVIKDYDLHPVTNIVEHIDFIDISKHETIALDVKLSFVNAQDSPGIKYGGVLNIVKKKINIICKVDALIKTIAIDLTGKLVGHSVRIKDLILPDNTFGYGIKYDPNDTIATILGKRSMKSGAASEDSEGEAAKS
ncbi:MAG: 50S ribosomal protein L25 [Anaplasmataceae bacterium]|nr:50S ribosomal protein L25 [Anaplasmataceae bacterium]